MTWQPPATSSEILVYTEKYLAETKRQVHSTNNYKEIASKL